MNVNVIKEFLVSLGFQIDDAGARKFDAVIVGATKNVIKLGATVEAAAGSVLLFTTKIASGLNQLYWASQRTGATVAGIQAIGYAASQTGSSAAAAQSALEGMARFLRNNPGGEGFLNRLGVQTRDASGNMRDMASIFTGVGTQLSKMPYYRANQYAQMLGIDENTLLAMRRGLGQFSGEYTAMAKAIGFNADTAAVSSNKFMTSLRDFGLMASMARDKIGSNLANGLAGSLDNFRRQILDNFPKIEDTITKVVKGVLWFAGVFGQMAYRAVQAVGDLMDWWKGLSDESKKLIGFLGLLAVAIRVLNSAFWASPIGIITGLAIAIALLYDDYKTWKEGGKSLIDWAKWQPDIEQAKNAIIWIRDHLIELKNHVGGWQHVLEGVAVYIGGKWALGILAAVARVTRGFGPLLAVMALVDAWKKVGDLQDEAKAKNTTPGDLLIQRKQEKDKEGAKFTDGLITDIENWFHKSINQQITIPKGLPGGALTPEQQAVTDSMKESALDTKKAAEQHAQSAKKIRETNLPQVVANQFSDTVKKLNDSTFAQNVANALLSALQVINPLAGNVQPGPGLMGNGTGVPRPTAAGSALLGWMQPVLSQLETLYHLPTGLLRADAIAESNGDPNAVSPAGAEGLFQLMPDTARKLGLRSGDAFDPMKSAQAAAQLLSKLIKQYGNLPDALRAYNWGPGNIQKYGMALMPQETRDYAPRVMSNMPGGGIQQETNITINGVSDPMAAARVVEQRQLSINSRLAQQSAGNN